MPIRLRSRRVLFLLAGLLAACRPLSTTSVPLPVTPTTVATIREILERTPTVVSDHNYWTPVTTMTKEPALEQRTIPRSSPTLVVWSVDEDALVPTKPVLVPHVTSTPLPTAISTDRSTTAISPPTKQGKALVINQTTQTLYVYENGERMKALPVSTGKQHSFTPAFQGRVGRYVRKLYGFGTLSDHAWYLTKATGDIYIHGAPYAWTDGKKEYQDLTAIGKRPSSHGCIRLHPADAAWLADWDPHNVPIIVTQPDFERFSD